MALHQWRPLSFGYSDISAPECSDRASRASSQTEENGNGGRRLSSSLSAGVKSRREVLGDCTNRVTASYEAASSEGSELSANYYLLQLQLYTIGDPLPYLWEHLL